ncbi:MAG: hypothetical protein CMI02_09380 [Oceanospirillaceae bacterium]|nr:hypothetical protein [Oceanospirillaceae bacterium]MBT12234.1 hypothetical protein [Oceanospirillaceae bacterium]|tara:strand:+ start:24893 stop:27340 length:2448 start_codon:yes stop_codon:yes gene_type:complete
MTRGKPYSLRYILLIWSVLALGVTSVTISYFLYQGLTSQYTSSWLNKMEAELTSLNQTIQGQLVSNDWSLADRSLTQMSTRYHVRHLCLVLDGKVRLSTRRADIGQRYDTASLPAGLDPEKNHYQTSQDGTQFYALLPVSIRTGKLRNTERGWLIAHYDTRYQYEQLLQKTALRIALLLGLLSLYALGLKQIVQREVTRPLNRLVEFTQSLRDGHLGNVIRSRASQEFSQLESAFNSLSRHLQHTVQQVHDQYMRDQAFTRAFPDVALLIDNNGLVRSRYGNHESAIRELNRDLIGEHFACWLKNHEADRLEQCRHQAVTTQDTVIVEFRHGDFFIESRMAPLLDESNADHVVTNGVLWLIRDISEVKRKQQLIEYQANFDPLTNLANRRFALLHIEKKMAHARRIGKFGAVLFIDLDHFKNINDSLGHPIGDSILIEMGSRLLQAVREEDLTARLGGDEFLVLFDELSDSPEASASLASDCAARLLDTIREPFRLDIQNFHLSASIGISLYPFVNQDASDLIRQADTAMYHAKSQGRNDISLYTENMQQQTQDKLNLFNDLHQAINDQKFALVFQPQYNSSGAITGAEALCRWNNHGTPVRPDIFIAAAEETNLIIPLGLWILQQSCRYLRNWLDNRQLPPSFRRLAVNISPAQFMDPGFEHLVDQCLQEYRLPPNLLELEITESVFLGNKEIIRNKMKSLHQQGLSFALDDFGTGYSSLSYLQNLPLDKLKIDRSFVTDIVAVSQPARIVDSIIQMGRSLNMEIIAEGVETTEQRLYLQAHQCYQYQGFLFSKPLEEEAFLDQLRQNTEIQSA